MEKIILFGTGKRGKNVYKIIKKEYFEIICFWDNNREKEGTTLFGIPICRPSSNISGINKIIICSVFYEEIEDQLREEFQINEELISSPDYFFFHDLSLDRKNILETYKNSQNIEIREIIDYLENHQLGVFNNKFIEKYEAMQIKAFYDQDCTLFYVLHGNKRMYFSRKLNTKDKVIEYYKSLLIEQDEASPHCYLSENFNVNEDDIVIDAGAAEGIFALSIIDKVKNIYLIEPDENWIEALAYTFKKYKEKVVLIPKLLGDSSSETHITIDDINRKEKISFIKLDIEGAEKIALEGAKETLRTNSNLKVVCCVYHNHEDGQVLEHIMKEQGFTSKYSDGYMYYPHNPYIFDNKLARGGSDLRHGVLRSSCKLDENI